MTPSTTHQTVRLSRGKHSSPDDGACVMELASMLAGERFSDRPKAVCPTIGAYLRAYNDGIDDDRRQALYELAALVVGTAGSRRDRRERIDLCRRRFAELSLGAAPARTPFGATASGTATACANAYLRLGDHDGAIRFARELAAVGRPIDRDGAVATGTEPAAEATGRFRRSRPARA